MHEKEYTINSDILNKILENNEELMIKQSTTYMFQWCRSLVFNVQMYLSLMFFSLIFLPWMIVSRRGALVAVWCFANYVRWSASWIVNLKTEIRGKVPTNEVLIASKHQSFLDIIMIYSVIPNGRFIMKRELLYIPIFGQYAYRLGCVAVTRGKRGRAIFQMLKDLERRSSIGGQLVVYPQGTRVEPGKKKPYKIGAALIYEKLDQTCVPVSTNAGYFWPRRGIYRHPGTAVIEFLNPIPPKLDKGDFLKKLEVVIETSSEQLLLETKY